MLRSASFSQHRPDVLSRLYHHNGLAFILCIAMAFGSFSLYSRVLGFSQLVGVGLGTDRW